MAITRIKAILWLHTLRLRRYKWSFLNTILSETAWIFLFILGALLFVPSKYMDIAVKEAFWIIVAWNIISQFSSLIGGWMNFFISIGMVEEHTVRGVSPFKMILGRIIPSFTVIVGSLLFMAAILNGVFKTNVLHINNPALLVFSFLILFLEGLSYGLTIAAISIRTSVPYNMLEILNFAVIGLLMIPVQNLPGLMRIAYLCIPYVAPVHLAKIATGINVSALFFEALAISMVEALIMGLAALYFIKSSERWMKRNGVRSVGFW